ncbi:antichymotrypsin-2-like isoform X4 [Sitophilus oryzae]|uniref:Antichymotrypsin-2-like isoform X4 n=1 Tax=Sitophilus oryzae TaxID=7048 RepID=A0A6J2XII6_SITOR|nr:antichymotrypsin-2-like isoform X4 [Sitophilus oryzae]
MKHTSSLFRFDIKIKRTPHFGLLFLLLLVHATMSAKQELQTVVQGNGLFTKQLYDVLSKEKGNVFFSPISVHAVLSMAYQGSKGATHDALAKSLNLPDHIAAAEGYYDVLTQLNNISGVELALANKIYIKDSLTPKASFREVIEKKFLSGIEPIKFTESEKAAKTINTWVEQKTKDKIKNLINPGDLDDSTALILLNAIYFKGNWGLKFNKDATEKDKFYVNDNDSIEVDMMSNKGKFNYKEDQNLDAKVLELPYKNPDVSMIIILPNKRNGIAELEAKLVGVDLTKITENMFRPEVVVRLPKFKIETTIELNEPLKKLGLGVLFGQKADFSEMLESAEPLAVSKVVQKAFIEVNEEGTEAAAATSVGIMLMSMPLPPIPFTVDHPFLLVLQQKNKELSTTNLLFAGHISDPAKSGAQ